MKIPRSDLVKRMLLIAFSSLVVCLANAATVIWREGYEGQRFGWADWSGWGGGSALIPEPSAALLLLVGGMLLALRRRRGNPLL